MSRTFTQTFHCTGTRADRHQCRRTVTGTGESATHAEQAATDAAVLGGWGVVGNDWNLAELRGTRCPRHSA